MIVKRQNKKDNRYEITKKRIPSKSDLIICKRKPEIAPAVIQTIAAAAPKIFFLTRRCLKGRNVACVRSKEIAPRLINDAMGETLAKTEIQRINSSLSGGLIVQSPHWYNWIGERMKKLTPVNISAKARLITKYMLRLRRLRSFR